MKYMVDSGFFSHRFFMLAYKSFATLWVLVIDGGTFLKVGGPIRSLTGRAQMVALGPQNPTIVL